MYKSAIERLIKFHSNTLNKTKWRDMPCSWKKIERIYIYMCICVCVCIHIHINLIYVCLYIYISVYIYWEK